MFGMLLPLMEDTSSTGQVTISVTDKIVPNLWAFITQFLAFIIMIVIVTKLAYKPVHKFIATRKAYIKDNLNSAAKQNAEAKVALDQANANLNQSKRQASEIVVAAQKQAEEDKARYEDQLKQELQMKRIQAEQDIAAEKKQALLESRSQIVDIALQASASLLGREVTSADNKKYVNQFVEDLSEKEAGKN
jgi:F-type H+-transporting ATPase subunit b